MINDPRLPVNHYQRLLTINDDRLTMINYRLTIINDY